MQSATKPSTLPAIPATLPLPLCLQILSYHVIPGQAVTAAQLTNGKRIALPTVVLLCCATLRCAALTCAAGSWPPPLHTL